MYNLKEVVIFCKNSALVKKDFQQVCQNCATKTLKMKQTSSFSAGDEQVSIVSAGQLFYLLFYPPYRLKSQFN